ncbi:restriction endonuclease [Salmonella enterica subsp. enterica serovar Newport]|nr:restriction endonuclease [Salmonella enterica subsp. enterica serovar Newport]
MPFHIGSGCLPATISNRRIYRIAWSDTPPEMSSWEKMKEFFSVIAAFIVLPGLIPPLK